MLGAIETTGDTCGVALFRGNELVAELHVDIPRVHDRLLAQLYAELLRISGVEPRDVRTLAVSVGPGSYTGIRIGIAFAIGVSLATGAALVAVPTLDAIAFNVRDLARVGHRARVISLIPAGRHGLYAALYEIQPEFRHLTEVRTIPAAEVPPLLDENVFAAGPGARLIAASCIECIAVDSETLTARAVGKRGIELRRYGATTTPAGIEPLYISGLPPAKSSPAQHDRRV
jgi:tRNA threonylcarbamoyl adenosine modification protein YeaZ